METNTLSGRMNIQTGGGPTKMETYAGAPGDVLQVPSDIAAMARRLGYAAPDTEPDTGPDTETKTKARKR
jgi:hypothetical protein